MIFGIGTDVLQAERVEKTWQRYGEHFARRLLLDEELELFGTAMVTTNDYDTRSNVLYWNGVVVREDLSSAVFLQRGFSAAELGTSDVESSQRMWTGTVGVKGGFDVGAKDQPFLHAAGNERQNAFVADEQIGLGDDPPHGFGCPVEAVVADADDGDVRA